MESIFAFLTGTWFICFTNFPMWTKGDKTDPTFHYEIITNKKGIKVLSDEVRYLKKGKTKSIKGIDTPSVSDANTFIWRGKGFLKPLHSKWRVALKDEEKGQWALIYFSKTLFTPEGIDLVSRTPSLSDETWEEIRAQMLSDPLLAKHLALIKDIRSRNNKAL